MMISYKNQIREGGRSAGGLCTILQPLFQLWFSPVNPATLTCVQLVSYNRNCVVTQVLEAIMLPFLLKVTQIESQPINFFFFCFLSAKLHSTNHLSLEPRTILWQERVYREENIFRELHKERNMFPLSSTSHFLKINRSFSM